MHLVRPDRDAADLDAVDRAPEFQSELADEAGEGSGLRMLRSQDRGDPISQKLPLLTRSSGTQALAWSTVGPDMF
jgi:hypothetical protein